jgi:hypothetical protein
MSLDTLMGFFGLIGIPGYLLSGSLFARGGEFGAFAVPVTRIAWTPRASVASAASELTGLAIGNGQVLMVDATGEVQISLNDGVTWAALSTLSPSLEYGCIAYVGGNTWIIGTNNDGVGAHVLRSTDNGLTWTDLGVVWTNKAIQGFVYNPHLNVITAWDTGSGNGIHMLYSSNGGATWVVETTYASYEVNQLIYNADAQVFAGVVLVFAGGFIAPYLVTSPDGITWTQTLLDATHNDVFEGIGYSGGQYIISGYNNNTGAPIVRVGTGVAGIVTGADVNLSTLLPTEFNMTNCAYNGTRYVALGEEATEVSSLDGITWQADALNFNPGGSLPISGTLIQGATHYLACGTRNSISTLP